MSFLTDIFIRISGFVMWTIFKIGLYITGKNKVRVTIKDPINQRLITFHFKIRIYSTRRGLYNRIKKVIHETGYEFDLNHFVELDFE